MPVGKVTAVHDGSSVKEIFVSPAALESSPEDVLVITEGVNQAIPEYQAPAKQVYLGPDPNPQAADTAPPAAPLQTTADRVMEKYRQIGEQQGHKYGVNPGGARPIDFNIKLNPDAPKPKVPAPGSAKANESSPPPAVRGEDSVVIPPLSTAPPATPAPAAKPPAAPQAPAPR